MKALTKIFARRPALLFPVSIAFVGICLAPALVHAQADPPAVEALPTEATADPAPATGAPAAPAPTAPALAQAPVDKPAGYYYYCDRVHAYFPAAQTCPDGWVAIPAQAPVAQPYYGWRRVPLLTAAQSEEIVRQRPTAISVELFGRALDYSFDIDHAFSEHFTLGIGIAAWRETDWWHDYRANITVVPIYGNYYFTERNRRGFLSAGVDLINVSVAGDPNDTFENSGAAAVLGGGYEYRERSGFLFRLGVYGIVGRSFTFSPSAVFGYAF